MEYRSSVTRYLLNLRPSTPAGIAAAYVAVGVVWIVVTDRLAGPYAPAAFQTYKGVFFILVTAAAIYLLLMRRRVVRSEDLDDLARHAAESDQLTRSLETVRGAQAALAQSEARLRRVIDASLDAVVTVAADDLVLEWNEEAGRLFGWTPAEAIGEKLAELIVPPARREEYALLMKQTLAQARGSAPARRLETVAVDRLDREFSVEVTIAPVEWGDRTMITLFMRDISARVQGAQEAQLIEAVVNAAPFAIASLDDEGHILSWNRAAEEMYGWTAEQLREASIDVLFPDDSTELAPLLERVRLGVDVDAEQAQHVRRDGKLMTVVHTLAPLPAVGRSPRAALITIDLSERELLERRLSDAEYLASLGRLAGTVAHEFNNVMMGIQSFAEAITRAGAEPGVERAAAQIRLGIQRGRRITEDILRFTRAAVAPTLQAIVVDDWLRNIAAELRELAGHDVTVEIEPGAPGLHVIGDQGQLHQALINLAINAKDAMPDGGSLRLVSSASPVPGADPQRDPWVEIIVSDTGTGMDEETAAHAFEPLFTTKKRGGTGLGLAVVQKIVRAHGGQVSLQSRPNAGTAFRIRLPARRGTVAGETAVPASGSFQPRRILLVEDDLAVAAGLADVLRSFDMIVDVLHSGVGVVQEVERFRPDVLVLDVGLPDRSGIEVYGDIAALYPRLPVVFSTGHADEARLEDVLSRPHVGFLRKPYPIESLLDRIEELTG
ncbi:MAG TPA: PAS domain S-box protein [Thermoanaerobaculia bacterium]|nr:PAS domain S-box protein [Thermoanaerobaculia bacterium]